MADAAKPQVLFLDDDEDLRSIFQETLSSCFGVHCMTVASMAELVASRERAFTCALAVLDVNLGAGLPSGIDAYSWLRAQGFDRKVVFLTGHASSHPLVREAVRPGDARVLEKPITLETLRALVAEIQT